MPWTPAQNKLFRAAEHNPAIAKSSGIPQATAARMAHEGIKRMAAGGSTSFGPIVEPRLFADGGGYDPTAPTPGYTPPPQPSLWDRIYGGGEAALSAATAPVGQAAGLGSALLHRLHGDVGTGPGQEPFESTYNRVAAANTYEPRTATGKSYANKLGDWASNVPPILPEVPGMAAALGHAAPALADALPRGSGAGPAFANQVGAIKPKGGNWAPWGMEQYLDSLEHAPGNPAIAQRAGRPLTTEDAVTDWKNKQLSRYMKTYLGTAEDPLHELAAQGQLHMTPEQLAENSAHHGFSGRLAAQPDAHPVGGYTMVANENPTAAAYHEQVTGRGYRTPWENLSDAQIMQMPASEQIANIHHQSGYDLQQPMLPVSGAGVDPMEQAVHQQYGFLAKDPNQKVYDFEGRMGADDPLGFGHVLDYLRQSGLTPEQLSKVSVPDAVRATSQWNAKNAGSESQKLIDARKAGIVATHTEYPSGYAWHQLGPDALDAEGKMMGHCVGSYCDSVKNRGTEIYSLSDEKGAPHATVEVKQPRAFFDPMQDLQTKVASALDDRYPGIMNQYQQAFTDSKQHTMHYAENFWPWFRNNHPDKYSAVVDEMPPKDIVQIKGKQNAAPVAQYQPYVQDFVKNGNWGQVRDIHNTGLVDLKTQQGSEAAQAKLGRFATADEIQAHLEDNPPGHALGGPIRMSGVRSAPSAPTTNDSSIAHVHRITGQKFYPLRFAGGGAARDAQEDVTLHHHLKYLEGVLNATY